MLSKLILPVWLILSCLTNTSAQKPVVSWGEEFKLTRGSSDFAIIAADKNGVFVKEGHAAMKMYYVVGATYRGSATLIRFDKTLSEVYKNNFDKELKGKVFEDFFYIKNKLYLLATDYSVKRKLMMLYACEIDQEDGKLQDDWKEVTSWQKEEKNDAVDFKTSYNADSSRMIIVSMSRAREKNQYQVSEYDSRLNLVGKTATITNEFDSKTFQLEDVIYTLNSSIIIVGRVYAFEEGKKKKDKFLNFQNYSIRIYDNTGSLKKEINTDIDGKWLISAKILQVRDKDIVLAAFFSETKKGAIKGMLVQRINPTSGEVLSTNKKEINFSMINGNDSTDNAAENTTLSKKEKEEIEKAKSNEEGFSRYFRFRDFLVTEDNGIVIIAEQYHNYQYTTSSTTRSGTGANATFSTTYTTYEVYECGNILMSRMEANGNLAWLQMLPKDQVESFALSRQGGGISFSSSSYFNGFNFPFYAGIATIPIPGKNMVSIIFNDKSANGDVMQPGQKVKTIRLFGDSECFGVFLDATTGKYTRKSLFNNEDIPTAMPRLGISIGKDFYMIGKNNRTFGKTKIALGKISFK